MTHRVRRYGFLDMTVDLDGSHIVGGTSKSEVASIQGSHFVSTNNQPISITPFPRWYSFRRITVAKSSIMPRVFSRNLSRGNDL